MLRYMTDRARPGLVLYNIRPGNGAGQFLQPQSPHRACVGGSVSKLRASILNKLGLLRSDHLQRIKFWPSRAPGEGCAAG